MSYQVNDLGDGTFQLVETRITAIGVIFNKRHAERFANWLELQEEHEAQQLEACISTEVMPKPDALMVADPIIGEANLADLAVAGAAPVADVQPPRMRVPLSPSETQLEKAFRRIREGEKLGTVADDMGLDFHRLRSRWAQQSKRAKAAAGAGTATSDSTCNTCGRGYKASHDDEGLCARCSRDLVR